MDAVQTLEQFSGIGGVPIVIMCVNMTKARVQPDYWPALALVFGVLVALVFAVILQTDLRIAVGTGIVSGYLAQQQYDKGHDAAKEDGAANGDVAPAVATRLDQFVPRG